MVDNRRNEDRRRWKGLSWSYETILAQEENSATLHCLSATTVMLLASIVDYIGWQTRYDGVGIDLDKIDEWSTRAAYELGGFMLRKNGCKLEMSCDGINWTVVLDLGECGSNTALIMSTNYEENITTIVNDYTGTPESINCPDVVYDSSEMDDHRDVGLCFAVRGFVEATARTWVEKDQGEDSRNRLIQSAGVLVAGGILGAFTLATGGIGGLVAGAIGSAVALAVINVDLDDETQLYAERTIDDVSCCMYISLMGATPSEASFQASLSSCGLTSDSYADKLREIMNEVVQSQDTYLSFLKMWNEYVSYSEHGLITNECDCLRYDVERLLISPTPSDIEITHGTQRADCVGGVKIGVNFSMGQDILVDTIHVTIGDISTPLADLDIYLKLDGVSTLVEEKLVPNGTYHFPITPTLADTVRIYASRPWDWEMFMIGCAGDIV